jgi:hypothetical protein
MFEGGGGQLNIEKDKNISITLSFYAEVDFALLNAATSNFSSA